MTTWLTGNPRWGFPILYLGWAYVCWIPIIASGTSVWSGTNLVLFLAGGASPMLAGVWLAWRTEGRDGVADLGRRLVDVGRVGARWWPFLIGFWLVFDLVMAGAAVLLGVSERPLDVATAVLGDPGALAFLLVLSFVFPAVEEVGLRGYWLDQLRERHSTTVAGLVNGVTWAVWHAPFVLLPGYYDSTSFDPELSWWLPMIVCDTLLLVWVYDRTRRSILAALVLHGMMNLTGELLGIAPDMYPFVLTGHLLVAGAVLVDWRRHARADREPGRPREAAAQDLLPRR